MSKKQKTLPLIEEETKAPCDCSKECKCGTACDCSSKSKCSDSCTCGDTGKCSCGNTCKCSSGSSFSGRTFAKCFTTLFGAFMITTAILMAAETTNKNIDLQVETYLRNNGKVIYEVIETEKQHIEEEQRLAAEKARQEAEARRLKELTELKDKLANDKSYYSLGNPDGKYIIVEFFDYRCGWCQRTNKAIWEEISSGRAKNIRWIPVDSPIFGEASMLISQYVLAAGKQGKFSEMHHAVVNAEGELTAEALVEIAKNIGLDTEQLTKDALSDEIKTKIVDNIALAQKIGVEGVPFLILNGKPNEGALLGAKLVDAVKESNQ